MKTVFYIGNKQSSNYTVNSAKDIHTAFTYNSREEAEANLERVGLELVEENKREAAVAGEEYDPRDPDQFQPEDLQVFQITIDESDWSE